MTSSSYQHSATFASLKAVKEELTTNFTSFQLLSTLDFFLESAIDPIISGFPDLPDVYFAQVTAYQFANPNVKCSRDDKVELPARLFNSLTTHGKHKRLHQRKMVLNRGLLFGLVSVFLKTVNTYRQLQDPHTQIDRTSRKLLLQVAERRAGSSYLYSAIMEAEYWIGKAHKFKELIIQKYIRMTIMQAKKTYEDIDYAKELSDLIQIYLIYLAKAIDRCDSRQGVLTPYIKFWFYSAKSEILKSVAKDGLGTSYDQLLEAGVEAQSIGPDSQYEALQYLSSVAKSIDPSGIFRFALQIPEHWSSKDLRTLKLFSNSTST